MTSNETQATGIKIRRLTPADKDAVERLAELDSGRVPEGELLGAEVEDRLLAVISLRDKTIVADPFSRSGELRDLLALRAAQLRHRQPRRRFRALRGERSARAALAGSPPGAGGKLLSLRPY